MNDNKQSRVNPADAHPSGNVQSLVTLPSTGSVLPLLLHRPSSIPDNRRGDGSFQTELNPEQVPFLLALSSVINIFSEVEQYISEIDS